MVFVEIVLLLLVILVAAEVFTNALEHLGERLKISEGVTGSLFAAVGTALPETMVPLLAIFSGGKNVQVNEEIGVGAILGAPLMLTTLSIFLMGVFAWARRGATAELKPERSGFTRDLNFFLMAFMLSALAMFLPHEPSIWRLILAMGMVLIYFIYIMLTLRASEQLVQDGHGTEAEKPMFLARIGFRNNIFSIVLQLLLGLALLIAGTKGFILCVADASQILGISALLLSLLIIPIATELPEKVNSILWIRKGKDTLALGNITGALVFQGTLLPAIGIMLTAWTPQREVLTGVLITFVAALWLRVMIARGTLRVWHLAANGVLYVLYLVLVLR